MTGTIRFPLFRGFPVRGNRAKIARLSQRSYFTDFVAVLALVVFADVNLDGSSVPLPQIRVKVKLRGFAAVGAKILPLLHDKLLGSGLAARFAFPFDAKGIDVVAKAIGAKRLALTGVP